MKKLCIFLLSLAAFGISNVSAEQSTYSKPGSLSAQAGLGLYWGHYDGLDIEGGVDLGLVQVPFANVLPIDFGVSGRVGLGIGAWGGLSVGAFGTAHYSWKALGAKLDWLNRLESYLAIGVQILPGLNLDGYGGNAYHIDQNFAVFYEGGYHASVLGVSYKFN